MPCLKCECLCRKRKRCCGSKSLVGARAMCVCVYFACTCELRYSRKEKASDSFLYQWICSTFTITSKNDTTVECTYAASLTIPSRVYSKKGGSAESRLLCCFKTTKYQVRQCQTLVLNSEHTKQHQLQMTKRNNTPQTGAVGAGGRS